MRSILSVHALIFLLTSCCLILLVACQSTPPIEPATSLTSIPTLPKEIPTPSMATLSVSSATSQPTSPTTITPEMVAASGLSGIVIAESDAGSQPDVPLANHLVIVMPVEILQGMLNRPTDSLSDQELRFLSLTLQSDHTGLVTGLTDAKGRYNLTLGPGVYALCLAYSNGVEPADFPLTTQGCGQVIIQPKTIHQVNISSGFGEILLVEPLP